MEEWTLRHRKKVADITEKMDMFPKVPETCRETSPLSGIFSIITFVIILILVSSEIVYYKTSNVVYFYEVDSNMNSKLTVNLDLTVAMTCENVDLNLVDVAAKNLPHHGEITETPVHFELDSVTRHQYDMYKQVNTYLKTSYHSLHNVLHTADYMYGFNFLRSFATFTDNQKKANPTSDKPHDGCRFNGSFVTDKRAGNIHLSMSRTIQIVGFGGAQLQIISNIQQKTNFSHRIDHWSFGSTVNGLIYPLDSEEKLTTSDMTSYEYYLQVVPTDVSTSSVTMDTYQFSITEQSKNISHSQGVHGMPGLMFKYDFSPIRVIIREVHASFLYFLVKLCAIAGGVFATTFAIRSFVGYCSTAYEKQSTTTSS